MIQVSKTLQIIWVLKLGTYVEKREIVAFIMLELLKKFNKLSGLMQKS